MSRLYERDIAISPKMEIRFNGKYLGEDMMKFVREAVIEDEENMLPLARVTIYDTEGVWLTDKSVIKGTNIAIMMGHIKDPANYKELFNGRITHVDPVFPQEGYATLTINCIDRGIDLMKARKAKSWKKKKISEVIASMIGECGLAYEVEDTKAVLEMVALEDETYLEFITRWRKILGWYFYKKRQNNGKSWKYYFGSKPYGTPGGQNGTLGYKTGGMEIISFEPTYVEYETEEQTPKAQIDNHKGIIEKKKIGETNRGMLGETFTGNAGYTGGSYPTGKASSK